MAFKKMTAAEAARFVKNGDNVGLSGFTPAGTPLRTCPPYMRPERTS